MSKELFEEYGYEPPTAEEVAQMELSRITQAGQLKSICTTEQQEKLQKLMIDIRDYFQPVKRK